MEIEKIINTLSEFSDNEAGVTRLPFTVSSINAFNYVQTIMKKIGLVTYSDKYGTIQGHLSGKIKDSIIIASHYDSVINGGKYDGIVGIVVGLAVADYFISNKILPNYSIDIWALNDEEGVRFNQGFLSSKAITNTLNDNEIFDNKTKIPLSKFLEKNLYGNDNISLKTTLKNARGYVETHIEQGIILEKGNYDLGLVQNIVGIKRFYITVIGESGHAGTIPMKYRSDALVKASQLITKIYDIPFKYEDSVLTIGYLNVSPNAINIIPHKVTFSIDIRSSDIIKLNQIEKDIENIINKNNNKDIIIEKSTNVLPVSLLNEQTNGLEEIIKKYKVNYIPINSGAGHDSQIFSEFLPTSMLFVPSQKGYSHRPDEYTDVKYINKAIDVLCKYLM